MVSASNFPSNAVVYPEDFDRAPRVIHELDLGGDPTRERPEIGGCYCVGNLSLCGPRGGLS